MQRTTTGQGTAKKAAWSLLLVLALISATMLSAAPAMAQVSQEAEQESESGGVATEFSVENSGNYAGQCVPALQFGNSGNLNNAPSVLKDAGQADDFEPGGIEFAAEPRLAAECSQEVQQAAAASSAPRTEEKKAEAPKAGTSKATAAPAPKPEAKAAAPEAKAEARVEAPKVEAKAGATETNAAPKAEQAKAAPKELPNTGGDTLPIVGVAGALLVGGGLLIRKLSQ